jgi:hypothetical protein
MAYLDEDATFLVAEFWEKTDTHGRDIHDLTLFQAGELFSPRKDDGLRETGVKDE